MSLTQRRIPKPSVAGTENIGCKIRRGVEGSRETYASPYPWPSVCRLCKYGCANEICTPCRDLFNRGITLKTPTFPLGASLSVAEIRYQQQFHIHKTKLIIHPRAYEYIMNKTPTGFTTVPLKLEQRDDTWTRRDGYYFL